MHDSPVPQGPHLTAAWQQGVLATPRIGRRLSSLHSVSTYRQEGN